MQLNKQICAYKPIFMQSIKLENLNNNNMTEM